MTKVDLRRAIERHSPDIDRETIKDFFSRMDQDYFSLYTPEEISRHIRMSGSIDPEHPIQLRVTPRGENRFDIIIVSFDYFSEFSIICGLMASFGFDIEKGNIYTFSRTSRTESSRSNFPAKDRGNKGRVSPSGSPVKIVDIFNVRLSEGNGFDRLKKLELEEELSSLIRLLREGLFQEAREQLNLRLAEYLEKTKDLFTSLLYPVEVRFNNRISREWTVMDLHSKDTPAFLYAVSNALSMRGIYIHKVRIESVGTEVLDRFYISDREGHKILGKEEKNALRMAMVLIKQFTHFLPRAPDPAKAILAFDQLLDKLLEEKRPGHILSFISERDGLDLMAHLLGTSDFLWEDFLRMRFENLMPVLEDLKERPLRPGKKILYQELSAHISGCNTIEEKKKTINEFKDREIFSIDIKHLLDPHTTLIDFSCALSDLTEVVLDQAYLSCHQELIKRYGLPLMEDGTACSFSICGLGKFGGREMGYASDVELLFIYSGPGHTNGDNSIDNSLYFERLAQDIIDFIEARHEGIFHIDLRLRPYGTAGSLANSIENVMAYYSSCGDAAQFERQALIKLRWVAGDETLGQQMEAHRNSFVYSGVPFDLGGALHLRKRQARELVKPGQVNVKYSPGGIIDIEYAVQYLQIMHGNGHAGLMTPSTLEALDGLNKVGVIGQEDYISLREAYIFLRALIDALRIVRGNARDIILSDEDSPEFKFLARRFGYRGRYRDKETKRLAEEIKFHMTKVMQFFVTRFNTSKFDKLT
ncbi:MAG: hypothetical protein AAB014_05370 [Nitrospirota bacterium]